MTKRFIQNRGVSQLWKGMSSLFIACIPAHALYFSVFESLRARTKDIFIK